MLTLPPSQTPFLQNYIILISLVELQWCLCLICWATFLVLLSTNMGNLPLFPLLLCLKIISFVNLACSQGQTSHVCETDPVFLFPPFNSMNSESPLPMMTFLLEVPRKHLKNPHLRIIFLHHTLHFSASITPAPTCVKKHPTA